MRIFHFRNSDPPTEYGPDAASCTQHSAIKAKTTKAYESKIRKKFKIGARACFCCSLSSTLHVSADSTDNTLRMLTINKPWLTLIIQPILLTSSPNSDEPNRSVDKPALGPHPRPLFRPLPNHTLKSKHAKTPEHRPPRSQIHVPKVPVPKPHLHVKRARMRHRNQENGVQPPCLGPCEDGPHEHGADSTTLSRGMNEEAVEVCSPRQAPPRWWEIFISHYSFLGEETRFSSPHG